MDRPWLHLNESCLVNLRFGDHYPPHVKSGKYTADEASTAGTRAQTDPRTIFVCNARKLFLAHHGTTYNRCFSHLFRNNPPFRWLSHTHKLICSDVDVEVYRQCRGASSMSRCIVVDDVEVASRNNHENHSNANPTLIVDFRTRTINHHHPE